MKVTTMPMSKVESTIGRVLGIACPARASITPGICLKVLVAAMIFWRVLLPASLPGIFTGMRVSVGIGVTMLVGAEMVATSDGVADNWNQAYYGRSVTPPDILMTARAHNPNADQLADAISRAAGGAKTSLR